MSFGRPSNSVFSLGGAPPLKGSFPLDHEGECKEYMTRYLKCMKDNKQQSTECRHLSKSYLACRMDKGLMERTDWDALGFQEGVDASAKPKHQQGPTESGR
ncbi:hypothetical protein JCM21900_005234 [Sporobolomyces salmonicolor]|uniref:Cytochrome c oxidase assembly protein COX19 n=1 Tax=Sporidiobolus salmonicolor TaxID=5005 RepID=A0A0D6EIF0_SPOSA|nr:SPOSA6832_01352 [Sporobolomyces salmonicolor]